MCQALAKRIPPETCFVGIDIDARWLLFEDQQQHDRQINQSLTRIQFVGAALKANIVGDIVQRVDVSKMIRRKLR